MGKHDLLGPDGWPLIGTLSGELITEDECPTEQLWLSALDTATGLTMVLPRLSDEHPTGPMPATWAGAELDVATERRRAADVALSRDQHGKPPDHALLKRLLEALKHWNPHENRKD